MPGLISIIIFKNIPVDDTPPQYLPLNFKRGLRNTLFIDLGINESRHSQNTPLKNIKDYPKNISRKKMVTIRFITIIVFYICMTNQTKSVTVE